MDRLRGKLAGLLIDIQIGCTERAHLRKLRNQMTGLDLAKDHLIEIAVLITNGNLDIVAKVSN
jgi:oligoribonuclease (3'-5' exoribonuclease)